jgi:hypothetical protein
MATPAGLEPATCRLEGGCSIQLSYGVIYRAPGMDARRHQCVHWSSRVALKLSE